MKIIYVTSESYLDHSYSIAKELGKYENLVTYIQAKKETEEIKKWCSRLGAVFVKRKRYRNPFNFFAELKFILSIKLQHADLIWFNTVNFYQIPPVKLLLKRYLIMIHDVEFHPQLKDPFAVLTVKLTFALFKNKLCTASETQASIFEKKYGFKPRVFQLPLIDYFTDMASEKIPPKPENDLLKFFFFGSIKRYKGIETLIDAAEILERKGSNCIIHIYGKFRYEAEELLKRIEKLRIINIVDEFIRYDEIHNIYLQNDVQILPYKHVTQCGPLLIGYDELVPAICSDLPGFREYVADGKSGLLFSGAEELAEKMDLLIKKPELIHQMKEYIRTEITKKFSVKNLIKNYISIITD